ncbi:PLDc N-terminal domain-containing protein [Microbacterium sp. B2969]|uniref:PLDc N-terminal domain-containing protein n=1 Tax=Microbacterium alkaliflavum TaxID=3248839 RepID=A0ABW7Q649_9MICO
MTHTKRELTPPEKVGSAILGLLQVTFAFLAAWDLWHRPEETVRGSKWAWGAALLVNWIGPASYFLFGIKHERR